MTGAMSSPVPITHFSDVLCAWAYVAQIRLDELGRQFAGRIAVRSAFCSVFGDVHGKLEKSWSTRGALAGYRAHVESVVARFDHVTLSPRTWVEVVPASSMVPHAWIKAAEAERPGTGAAFAWALRLAFFRDGRDICNEAVLSEFAREHDLDAAALRARVADGSALAAVLRDYDEAAAEHVRGSPTFLLNEKRQTLYGNVGYKILEANVLELLREPGDAASWC